MTTMRGVFTIGAAALLCVVVAGCGATQSSKHERSEGREEKKEAAEPKELPLRKVAASAKTSLRQVLASAAAARSGTALEAGLEGEVAEGRTEVFFEVMVVDPAGNVWELRVDPVTAAVVSNRPEPEADEIEEMKTLAAKLGVHHMSLDELAARAEASTSGAKALAAAFKVKDGLATARVKLAKDGDVGAVLLDAKSGKVVAEKKKSDEEDEDDDDDEDEEQSGR